MSQVIPGVQLDPFPRNQNPQRDPEAAESASVYTFTLQSKVADEVFVNDEYAPLFVLCVNGATAVPFGMALDVIPLNTGTKFWEPAAMVHAVAVEKTIVWKGTTTVPFIVTTPVSFPIVVFSPADVLMLAVCVSAHLCVDVPNINVLSVAGTKPSAEAMYATAL